MKCVYVNVFSSSDFKDRILRMSKGLDI